MYIYIYKNDASNQDIDDDTKINDTNGTDALA